MDDEHELVFGCLERNFLIVESLRPVIFDALFSVYSSFRLFLFGVSALGCFGESKDLVV